MSDMKFEIHEKEEKHGTTQVIHYYCYWQMRREKLEPKGRRTNMI